MVECERKLRKTLPLRRNPHKKEGLTLDTGVNHFMIKSKVRKVIAEVRMAAMDYRGSTIV